MAYKHKAFPRCIQLENANSSVLVYKFLEVPLVLLFNFLLLRMKPVSRTTIIIIRIIKQPPATADDIIMKMSL
jgi:hypothetical protein